MADSLALPVGADQHKGGGRGSSMRRADRAVRARPRTTGKAQTLLSFCSSAGACSMCDSDRAELTRKGY